MKKSQEPKYSSSIFIKVLIILFILAGILLLQGNFKLFKDENAQIDKPVPSEEITDYPEQRSIVVSPHVKRLPPQKKENQEEWGISKQIGEHTYTIKVGQDEKMATAQEIFEALNEYRRVQGRGTLAWDGKLAEYAKKRTDYFVQEGNLDSHKGFNEYLTNENGFRELGFASLGENSSMGYKLSGVHLIEWVYASDIPHNENQLNSKWSHVGIGVTETATNIIFGSDRL